MVRVNAGSARKGGSSLDLLRFGAAAFILLFHFGESAPVRLRDAVPLFDNGWLATDFFLLLSGFVLSRAYGERLMGAHMRRSEFFFRRFARLWPSHVIVLAVFGLFITLATLLGHPPHHVENYGGDSFVAQAFLVHGWGVLPEPAWNIPTWTLSALLICYGLFSFYVPWIYHRSAAVLAGCAAAVLVAFEAASILMVHHALVDLPFAWGPLRAIPLFIIGSLAERLTRDIDVSARSYSWVVGLSLVSILVLAEMPRSAGLDSLILLLLCTVVTASGAVRLPEFKWTKRMGSASFALFLTHSLVGAVWFGVTPALIERLGLGAPLQWMLWGAGVIAAFVTAFLFDAWVDRPLSRWVSNRLKARAAARGTAQTTA